MAVAEKVKYAHETVELVWGKYPQAISMAKRFESLADNGEFIRHLEGLRAFRGGLDPIQDRDAHEAFLRSVGHDFAAVQVLPAGNFIRNLLPGVVREDYLALHGIIAALLLSGPGPLSRRRIIALYDTIDRILRGGADWPSTTHVPAATAKDYQMLRRIRDKHNPTTTLRRVTVAAGTQKLGSDFGLLGMVHFAAIGFITMAVTAKNGHTRVTVEDGWEAADAYLKLFEVSLLDLPPLVRDGRSGYELD